MAFLFYISILQSTVQPTSAYVNLTSRYDDMLKEISNKFLPRCFSVLQQCKIYDARYMSNFQCHCCSKLYRKQNFEVLKPNVNCVTGVQLKLRCTPCGVHTTKVGVGVRPTPPHTHLRWRRPWPGQQAGCVNANLGQMCHTPFVGPCSASRIDCNVK